VKQKQRLPAYAVLAGNHVLNAGKRLLSLFSSGHSDFTIRAVQFMQTDGQRVVPSDEITSLSSLLECDFHGQVLTQSASGITYSAIHFGWKSAAALLVHSLRVLSMHEPLPATVADTDATIIRTAALSFVSRLFFLSLP
jgi:hypothetical protein